MFDADSWKTNQPVAYGGGAWTHLNDKFCNTAFYDGHVEAVTIDQIPSGQLPNKPAGRGDQLKYFGVLWNNSATTWP